MSKVDSGITVHFYKDKHGTPSILFKWGEEADSLLGGNGFSDIQMRVILEGHLKDTHVPKYIKLLILELIKQLSYASENADEVLRQATKKRSSQQQYYRIMKKARPQTSNSIDGGQL